VPRSCAPSFREPPPRAQRPSAGQGCSWDAGAAVWVATSDDVPGLATGADTLDALVDKLKVVIPELLEANGLLRIDHPSPVLGCNT
jgi:hypothetical protein